LRDWEKVEGARRFGEGYKHPNPSPKRKGEAKVGRKRGSGTESRLVKSVCDKT